MVASIGPRREICKISGLPTAMVLRLHQSNGYTKRKLWKWRAQKCNALVGAWSQTTPFHGGSIGPKMDICQISGLPTAMVPRLHQSNGSIKWKLRVWRAKEFNALIGAETALTCVGSQTTPFPEGENRAENANMRNFGPTNSHGTAFTLKKWLHQKEATGMESSKKYCTRWCRNRTYLCGIVNYPIPWWGV